VSAPTFSAEKKILMSDALPLFSVPTLLDTAKGWAKRGLLVNGRRVFLEALRFGSRWWTSAEAVARFSAACLAPPPAAEPPVPPIEPVVEILPDDEAAKCQ
jgi:hypothetical protein